MRKQSQLPPLDLSINPSYYCNLRCEFCYLTTDQLGDKKRLAIDVLDDRLSEITKHYELRNIDLYGGEVFMLPKDYIRRLKSIIRKYTSGTINVVTNLTTDLYFLEDSDFYLTVSYDSHVRDQHDKVLKRLMEIDREFSILILASPKVLDIDPLEFHLELSQLPMLKSVEIKPYSPNQSNQLDVSNKRFEKWVMDFISLPLGRNYILVNEQNIRDSLSGERNTFSDDHLYITPSGKYGVLEFDESDNEYFLELETLSDYKQWSENEKNRVTSNVFCSKCDYLSRCLSEHLREVKSLDDSCNGFKGLLDWARTEPKFYGLNNIISFNRDFKEKWKRKMYLYNRTVTEHTDDLRLSHVVVKKPEWDDIEAYLVHRSNTLYYPAKSIAVAVIYGLMLVENYGGELSTYISDPELFLNTDKYFIPYGEDPDIDELYISTIAHINRTDDWKLRGWVPETLGYFKKECL